VLIDVVQIENFATSHPIFIVINSNMNMRI